MAERFYGGNKWSYGVTERQDGWIELHVYHENVAMHQCLRKHIDDPMYFLRRRGAFSRSNIRAERWLSEVMYDYASYFEQGLVRLILDPSALHLTN